jgi:hypothetical protein
LVQLIGGLNFGHDRFHQRIPVKRCLAGPPAALDMDEAVCVQEVARSWELLTVANYSKYQRAQISRSGEPFKNLLGVYRGGSTKWSERRGTDGVWFSMFGFTWSSIYFCRIPFLGGIVRLGVYLLVGLERRASRRGTVIPGLQVRKMEHDSMRARWKDRQLGNSKIIDTCLLSQKGQTVRNPFSRFDQSWLALPQRSFAC